MAQIVDGVYFWTSRTQYWASESQFPGNGIQLLACERRIFDLVVVFRSLGVESGTLGVFIRRLVVNFRPLGVNCGPLGVNFETKKLMESKFGPLGVGFGPLRVYFRSMGVDFRPVEGEFELC